MLKRIMKMTVIRRTLMFKMIMKMAVIRWTLIKEDQNDDSGVEDEVEMEHDYVNDKVNQDCLVQENPLNYCLMKKMIQNMRMAFRKK